MPEYQDRPPVPTPAKVENVASFHGLYESEKRGLEPRLDSDLTRVLGQFESTWQAGLGRLKDNLQGGGSQSSEKLAQFKIIEKQLDNLDHLPTQQKIAQFKAFRNNDGILAAAKFGAHKVQTAIGAGYLPAAEIEQRKVVDTLAKLDKNAAQGLITSCEQALAGEKDAKVKAVLQDSLSQTQTIAAAPFIEKSRLGAILLEENKFFQAEKMLKEALTQDIAPGAWQNQANRQLRGDVQNSLDQLHVQNNLPAVFGQNLKILDTTGDGSIDKAELAAADLKGASSDKTALVKFLTDNYDYLTRHHWPIFSKPGISSSDIDQYAQERSKQTNDLPLR